MDSTIRILTTPLRPDAKIAPLADARRDRAGPSVLPANSSLPQLIGLAQQLAAAGPPIDFARIAQIRQAIAQGEYEVDASAIADAICAKPGASQ